MICPKTQLPCSTSLCQVGMLLCAPEPAPFSVRLQQDNIELRERILSLEAELRAAKGEVTLADAFEHKASFQYERELLKFFQLWIDYNTLIGDNFRAKYGAEWDDFSLVQCAQACLKNDLASAPQAAQTSSETKPKDSL